MGQAIHSTGIPEIDKQHQALSALIEHYRCASTQLEEQEYLARLTESMETHFTFVASFFEIKFPTEFQKRQREIRDWVAIKIEQRNLAMIAQKNLAEELSGILLHNVNTMGTKLQSLES